MENNKSPLDRAEEMIAVGMDTHTTDVRNSLEGIQRRMLKEGMYNGAQGLRLPEDTIERKALGQAENCHKELSLLTENKLGTLRSEQTMATNHLGRLQDSWQNKQLDVRYYDTVSTFLTEGLTRMSRWFFKVFGVTLLAADIALSLELVRQGFQFPPSNDEDWRQLLQTNWQAVLTALGLTILTVVLKYVFDRFILAPYGMDYMMRTRMTQSMGKGEDITIPSGQMLKNIHRWEKVKGVGMVILALAVMMLFYLMSDFRSWSKEITRIEEKYKNEIALVEHSNEDRMIIIENKKKLKQTADVEVAAAREKSRDNNRLTFFGLTLLIPLASAVCFSIAGGYIKIRKKLEVIIKERREMEKDLEEAQKRFGRAEGELKAWELEQRYLACEDWIKNFAVRLVDLYQYGFRIGNIRPDLLQDIPHRLAAIEQYRNKRTLFKTNHLLLNQNDHEN